MDFFFFYLPYNLLKITFSNLLLVSVHMNYSQAEEFDRMNHSFLDQLANIERVLKYGVLPEEEDALLTFLTQHKVSGSSDIAIL